jgi:GrpB-like predicted nucleotidyltransferase (UPF0157 family)
MIGLDDDKVILLPHNPKWKNFFLEEKKLLEKTIGHYIISIEHIGSTAIPGIPAKPIIDIGVSVNDFDEAKICIKPIEELGYEYKGEHGIPRRHYFSKGNPGTHHLHLNEITSKDWTNQIKFRDFLRKNKLSAKEYANVKIKLAEKYPNNREAYLKGKDPFITKILNMK